MTGELPGLEVPAKLDSVTLGSAPSPGTGILDHIDALYSYKIENLTGSKDNKCRIASERDRTRLP